MPYIRPKKPRTYVQMQSLISFEGHPYYCRKVKGNHHIHQQTECSWGGFLIINIISGLFVYAVWDFVHNSHSNSHCGIMSCGILACGILSVGFCPVGFCSVGFCPWDFVLWDFGLWDYVRIPSQPAPPSHAPPSSYLARSSARIIHSKVSLQPITD